MNTGPGSRFMPFLMAALALIGVAVAFYESHSIYYHQPLWCPPPINGCNEVAASPYGHILGLPIAYFGMVFYLNMLGLALLLALDPLSRGLRVGAKSWASLGVLFSAYFMVLQIRYIHAFCIYCAISAVTTVLLTVTAVLHPRTAEGA